MGLKTSLVDYWKLDEASGDPVGVHAGIDLWENDPVGSNTGLVYATAREWTGYGNNQRFSRDLPQLHPGDADVTFAIWFRQDTTPPYSPPNLYHYLWAQQDYTGGYNIGVTITDKVFFASGQGGGVVDILHTDSISPGTGAWHLAICWYDTATSTLHAQIDNGAVIDYATGPHAAGTDWARVGADSSTNNNMDGRIGPIMMWNRLLTTTERTYLYNSGNGITYADLEPPTITPATITSAASVYAPGLHGTLAPATIASTAAVNNVTLTSRIDPATIASTASVYAPTVAEGTIQPDTIPGVTAIYAPTLSGQIAPDTLASVTSIPDPIIGGAATLAPDTIPSALAIYAPALSGQILPNTIASVTTLYAPALAAGAILPATIASTTAVYLVTLSGVLAPATIPTASSVYVPTLYDPALAPIMPAPIASVTTIYAPILLRDDDEATITTAWASTACLPLFRIVIGSGASAVTIAESRITLYSEQSLNRLGGVDIQINFDNTDEAFNALLGSVLAPGAHVWISAGARVAGVEYLRVRHEATLIQVKPNDVSNQTDQVIITARNNWHKLEKQLAQNYEYDGDTIGTVIDELAALAGVTVSRDADTLWSYVLYEFASSLGAPITTPISQLIGEVPNPQAIAYGRFTPLGTWSLFGVAAAPASDYSLAIQQAAAIAYHDDAITRCQILGADQALALSLDDLETAIGEQHYRTIDTMLIGNLATRAADEAIQQRELYRRGYVVTQPDPRLQLWHVLHLTNCPHVTDGTHARIDFISLVYKKGVFEMKLGLRIVALVATYTALSLLPHARPQPRTDTMSDNFSTYGGHEIAQTGSSGLYWLSIIRAEANETDVVINPDAALSASNVIEGEKSVALGTGSISREPATAIDFTQEGRFTADDYIVATVYAGAIPSGYISFIADPANTAELNLTSTGAGRYYYATKRSALTLTGAPDWSSIGKIIAQKTNAYLDDVRIVKADPDDPTTYNDTGRAWDFSAGVWHIYEDVPKIPYALGQIDNRSPGTRYAALRMGHYVARDHFAAGIYLREEGRAGLIAFAVDEDNCYEVKLDTTMNTVTLQRWINGVSKDIATASVPIDPLVKYYTGIRRVGHDLNVYLLVNASTAAVFDDSALVLHIADQTYHAGRLGLTSYGANTRFYQARAGSPQHALTAEYAYHANPLGHDHATGATWAAATGTASRATFATASVTLEELAKRVKAMIDDLKADSLIQ